MSCYCQLYLYVVCRPYSTNGYVYDKIETLSTISENTFYDNRHRMERRCSKMNLQLWNNESIWIITWSMFNVNGFISMQKDRKKSIETNSKGKTICNVKLLTSCSIHGKMSVMLKFIFTLNFSISSISSYFFAVCKR